MSMSISNRSYPHMILFQSKSHLNLPFAFANCHYVVAFFHVSSGALCVFFSVKCVCVCVKFHLSHSLFNLARLLVTLLWASVCDVCFFFGLSLHSLATHTQTERFNFKLAEEVFFRCASYKFAGISHILSCSFIPVCKMHIDFMITYQTKAPFYRCTLQLHTLKQNTESLQIFWKCAFGVVCVAVAVAVCVCRCRCCHRAI